MAFHAVAKQTVASAGSSYLQFIHKSVSVKYVKVDTTVYQTIIDETLLEQVDYTFHSTP